MLGRNARFASYGGVNTRTTTLRTMVVSGAICGVVGATIVFGSQYRLIDGAIVQTNYAWTALLVALLAGSGSIALLVTGFAFAAILAGGAALERSTGVSAQLANVTQAAIILLVSIRLALPTSWGRRSRSSGTPTEAEPVP
jgi:simple sugar transport system permease protein